MNVNEIRQAVDNGLTVFWCSPAYQVIKDKIGQYLIMYYKGDYVGLTWQNSDTLNGEESEFYLQGNKPHDI